MHESVKSAVRNNRSIAHLRWGQAGTLKTTPVTKEQMATVRALIDTYISGDTVRLLEERGYVLTFKTRHIHPRLGARVRSVYHPAGVKG